MQQRIRTSLVATVAASGLMLAAQSAQAATCESLSGLKFNDATVTLAQSVAAGAMTILASLFTDYRSYKQQRSDERKRSQADLAPVMPT